jgi:branched-chain amino acid transport system substrate-binding protein
MGSSHNIGYMSLRFRLYLLLLVQALALLAACDLGTPPPTTPPEVRVGFVFADNLPGKGGGNQQRKAVELALSELAALGGNVHIVPLFKEAGDDPESARQAFVELVGEQGAHVILGPTWSSEARAAHPVAQGAGVPVLAVSNTAGGITDLGEYVFRVSQSEGEVIPELVERAKERLELSKVSLVYDGSDPYSKAVADVFRAEMERQGVSIVGEYVLPEMRPDYKELAANIAEDAPAAVVVSALQARAWEVLGQIRAVSDLYVMGSSTFVSPEMLATHKEIANRLVFGVPWHPLSDDPLSREFVSNFEKRYGTVPDMLAAQAYAGTYLLHTALERTDLKGKSLAESRNAIRDALRSAGTVPTVLGPFSFTDKRNPKHLPTILVATEAKLEEMK